MYYKTKWNLTRQSGKMTLSASTKSLKFRFPDLQVQKFHFVCSNSTLSCRNFKSMKSQLSNAVSTKSVRLLVQKLSQFEISKYRHFLGWVAVKKKRHNFAEFNSVEPISQKIILSINLPVEPMVLLFPGLKFNMI